MILIGNFSFPIFKLDHFIFSLLELIWISIKTFSQSSKYKRLIPRHFIEYFLFFIIPYIRYLHCFVVWRSFIIIRVKTDFWLFIITVSCLPHRNDSSVEIKELISSKRESVNLKVHYTILFFQNDPFLKFYWYKNYETKNNYYIY